jgi:hypothetical protein
MKDLKKFIKTTIREYLNEQQILKENLDLSNRDNVIAWLDKNAPESIFDDDGNIDWGYADPMTGDDLEMLISTYMEKYDEVISEYEIEIYRLVKLNTIKDLDLKNVGVFWSFDENGGGCDRQLDALRMQSVFWKDLHTGRNRGLAIAEF